LGHPAISTRATNSAARNLAAAFLSGTWTVDSLTRAGALALGSGGRWLRHLARRVLQTFGEHPECVTVEAMAEVIAGHAGFRKACAEAWRLGESPVCDVFWPRSVMAPAPGPPSAWGVPALPTPGALAEWLGLTPRELDWFADCHGFEARVPDGPLRHYTYRPVSGRSGKVRLLEVPKARLKAVQRRLLAEILERVPPHDAAHGFRRGRSVVSYAAPHAGRALVLRFDLRDFFPSVPVGRVHALFRTAGYPEEVARLLTGLCTNSVPLDVCGRRRLYRWPHLPQGSPTSPALANLCAYRLDVRLAALARSVGGTYTRYADDLAFSGDEELARAGGRFRELVCRVVAEEGFEVNGRKTCIMRRGVRQQLAGVVVNVRTNVARREYDLLKAVLHNCRRHGPASQNRAGHADFRGHLAGRIAYVAMLHPERGRRLWEVFEQVRWAE
jgi:RNA-directed DNA polymerase